MRLSFFVSVWKLFSRVLNFMFSKRSQAVEASGIRRVFDLAANLSKPINLSIGQPCFDAFPEMKRAAVQAIEEGKNGYTLTQGIAPLRAKIREQYGYQEGQGYSEFVSSGTSGGLFLSYLCTLDPDDEVLIPDPYFCMYRDLAFMLNAKPVYYDTYPDYRIDVSKLEALLSKSTRAIVLNTPGNPTGAVLSQAEVESVLDFARKHDLWVFFDEIYSAFSYDAPAPKVFGIYDKTVILNGLSKSHGVPGWRLGYVVAQTELVQQMLKIQQYTFVCAPSMAQWAAVEGFNHELSDLIIDYRKKRDFVYEALKSKYEVEKPGGAFYIFPKAPALKSSNKGKEQTGGQTFVEECIKHNLLLVPGNVFSRRDSHFRISFSAPMQELERGVEVLLSLLS